MRFLLWGTPGFGWCSVAKISWEILLSASTSMIWTDSELIWIGINLGLGCT
uniref:Uncharacterized protein n=1 Tax=Arundo donax TaxID=35708 RepID=A0A0A8ZG68_ARUDO